MTTNSHPEATASSCPDWLTDKAMASIVDSEMIPGTLMIRQMAAEILRLRTALSRARIETQRTIDLIADPVEKRATKVALAARKAIGTVLNCRDLPAPPIDDVTEPFGLIGAVRAACEEVVRLRKENDVLRSESVRGNEAFAHIDRCLVSVERQLSPYDIGSRVGTAMAELLRLRREAKRDRADKAEAKLGEVARILGGNSDVLERAKAAAVKMAEWPLLVEQVRRASDGRDKLRAALMPYRDRPYPMGQLSKESTTAFACRVIAELSSYLAKARAERNEFAARQVERFVADAIPEGGSLSHLNWSDAARSRAALLRRGNVRDAIEAVDPSIAPMRRDASGRIALATPVRTAQIPSTEGLADIAYCRRDPGSASRGVISPSWWLPGGARAC